MVNSLIGMSVMSLVLTYVMQIYNALKVEMLSRFPSRRCLTTPATRRSSLRAHDDATIKYSTIQNWYPGDKEGKGGIYNFVTKRGLCAGRSSKITWTQVETGSAITWKYPSCILQGDNSIGEFYSVATTNNWQQADTGTKMIHVGKNTRSTIVSKGISAGHGQNTYRGAVRVGKNANNARNYSQCDSLLIGDKCGAHTFPYLEIRNTSARRSSTKRPRRKSARTRFSIAASAG